MKPRILYIITDSGIGGSEKILHNLLIKTPARVVEPEGVVVLKSRREMAEKWAETGAKVWSIGMRRWPTPLQLLKLKKIIREVRPDIIHAFLYHSIQLTRIIHMWDKKFKMVSSPRVNYQFASRMALFLDQGLKHIDDLVLCESKTSQRNLIERLSYAPEKVCVAANGVDNNEYRFIPEARQRLRKEWGIEEDEIVIGSVGRLHHQKGFDLLIQALNQLKKGPVRFKAIVVGSGPDESKLKKIARQFGLDVQFTGTRTDIPAVLSAFDVYVQSSRYEGLSNALLEAMSIGCACVATAVDGTLDFSEDGKNVLLVKPENFLSLAVGIGHLLEKPALRSKLSANAKITAQAHSLNGMVTEFDQAYSRLISSH